MRLGSVESNTSRGPAMEGPPGHQEEGHVDAKVRQWADREGSITFRLLGAGTSRSRL